MSSAAAAPSADEGEHPLVLHLRRDGDLSHNVRRGVLHEGGKRIVIQLLTIASTVVLARLLSPTDYGTFALTATVTGFAALFIDMGFTAAIVQAKRVSETMLTTAFLLNVVMAWGTALLVVASAPWVADFFDEPLLRNLLLIASLTMFLSINSVNVALMRRSLRFDLEGSISIVGALLSIVVMVTGAWAGLGAYSLVLGPVAERVSTVVLSFVRVRWVPRARPTRAAARQIWAFGSGLTGFTIVNYWARSADRLVIGRFVDIASLGLYNRAANLMNLPTSQVVDGLSRVFFPALSTMSDDPARLRRAWLRLVRIAALLGIPIGVGITVAAGDIVSALFGPKWLDMVPLLTLMSACIPFLVVGVNVGPLYQALGRTGLQFRVGLVTTAITLAFMVFGAWWGGVTGIAVMALIRCPITLYINGRPLLKIIQLSWAQVLLPLRWAVLAGLTMAGVLLLTSHLMGDWSPVGRLAVQAVVGALTYAVVALSFERTFIEEALGRKLPLPGWQRLRRAGRRSSEPRS